MMPSPSSILLGGIGADRDDVLGGIRLPSHIVIEPYGSPYTTTPSGLVPVGTSSPKQETIGVLRDRLLPIDDSIAPDISDASGEARHHAGSIASFDENVSSNSSGSSDPSDWTPLERFCKEHERHERIALMMLSLSNCKGIYRNYASIDHIDYDIPTPAAPTSTDANHSDIDDGYQEPLDLDHPLGRYLDQVEDHELLAIAITHPENSPPEIEYPSGLVPDTERDVTPTSMDAPSSISLHPSAPTTKSLIPMKRSADAIEAQDGSMSDLVAQQDELLKEVKHTLGAAQRGKGKPRMQRRPRFRKRLEGLTQHRRNIG